jgi:hypothetical protein
MKLTYRGVQYDYQPATIPVTETEVTGKYRGLDWRFRNLQKAPVLLPTTELTYRGVTYRKGETLPQTVPQVPTTSNIPVLSTEDKARCLMFNRTKTIKKRQQAMLSRSASALGLVINDYWNHIQGKVHPTFRHDYDRFGATMS